MMKRILGKSGLEVSALGMGCWAIGGVFWRDGKPIGWGEVDDAESIRAIRRARELGVTFFDTADIYGTGHSEILLGRALAGERNQVVIATKFGNVFEEGKRQAYGHDVSPQYIRAACDASLRRLGTDYIDLYQLHPSEVEPDIAMQVCDTLESLVKAGKIRFFGWSTDNPSLAQLWKDSPSYVSVQHQLNVFEDKPEMLQVVDEFNLASINRGPLARGLLTGKFQSDSTIHPNDVRRDWDFKAGLQAQRLRELAALEPVLTRDGRTLAQAALGWLWARNEHCIPIPGFKTVAQVEENVQAIQYGKLSGQQMQEVESILGR
ncbi:MAG TPA: aldo/keto reductase [Anaerolineaceae bacterium]|nr:aldo/keto reductase [Anaerolineaceae bacterium]